MTQRTFILKKDLFLIPKGHIFHTTYDGTKIYPYWTTEQVVQGAMMDLYYSITDVENNPDWFEEVTEQTDFVKQLNGTYKFVLPKNLALPNPIQETEVRRDGILVGHVTNFDIETGVGTIEILPEYATMIWKEIAGPYISSVSSRKLDEKVEKTVDNFFKDKLFEGIPTECHLIDRK